MFNQATPTLLFILKLFLSPGSSCWFVCLPSCLFLASLPQAFSYFFCSLSLLEQELRCRVALKGTHWTGLEKGVYWSFDFPSLGLHQRPKLDFFTAFNTMLQAQPPSPAFLPPGTLAHFSEPISENFSILSNPKSPGW